MYDAGSKTADWPTIKALGINCMYVGPGDPVISIFETEDAQAIIQCIDMTAAQIVAYVQSIPASVIYAISLGDEPTASQLPAFQALTDALHVGVPGVKTFTTCFDDTLIGQIAQMKAVDLVGLDAYPSRNNWDFSVITKLAAAADAAGIPYIGVIDAFTDGGAYPLPDAAQLQQSFDTWAATKQIGWIAYAWGNNGDPNEELQNEPTLLAVIKTAAAL